MNPENNVRPIALPFMGSEDLGLEDIDVTAVYKEAADLGINLSSQQHQTAIAASMERARDLVLVNYTNQQSKWFNWLKSAVTNCGNAVLVLLMTLLVYVAPPVTIMVLFIAETQRVSLGMGIIDPDRRVYYSVAGVLSYLTLLVIKSSRNQDTAQQLKPVFSVRLIFRRFKYVLGVGNEWKARGNTWSQVLDSSIVTVGRLIIFFGTFGVLVGKLVLFDGPWYSAIVSVFVDSDLVTFLSIIGGGIFTAGMLAGLHFLVEFTYNRYTALVPEVGASEGFFDKALEIQNAEKQAQVLYVRSVIARHKIRQQQNTPTE